MPFSLIPSHTIRDQSIDLKEKKILRISELFTNTIQGEGYSIGSPATFLRLQGCTLQCAWCDTTEVWKNGNPYTFSEIFQLFEKHQIIQTLQSEHLVITGGSPLKQQKQIIQFLQDFKKKYHYLPFIEVENECVLPIEKELIPLVNQWNNSPKLANSIMKKKARYKPEIISHTSQLKNSWFKFVIQNEREWEEIENNYLIPKLISKNQIILMPLADSKKELGKIRKKIVEIAIKYGVRFSDRLHITIFDKKTGV